MRNLAIILVLLSAIVFSYLFLTGKSINKIEISKPPKKKFYQSMMNINCIKITN